MEWIDVLPEAIRDPLLQKAMSLMMIKDKHKLAVAALPVAFLLAYIPHFIKIGVVGAVQYPIGEPRRSRSEAVFSPFAQRCAACHMNGLEGFAPFAAAVLAAKVLKSNPIKSAQLAWRYVFLRIAYTIVYLGGGGTTAAGWTRAVLWSAGFSGTISHFRLALKA